MMDHLDHIDDNAATADDGDDVDDDGDDDVDDDDDEWWWCRYGSCGNGVIDDGEDCDCGSEVFFASLTYKAKS